eukprot:13476.XXX_1067310_1067603_1 [CDS] Oithona nana genome sequencing.
MELLSTPQMTSEVLRIGRSEVVMLPVPLSLELELLAPRPEVGSASKSSACVIQSRYPRKSSSICCRSRCFWKSPLDLAFSRSLENSLQVFRAEKSKN